MSRVRSVLCPAELMPVSCARLIARVRALAWGAEYNRTFVGAHAPVCVQQDGEESGGVSIATVVAALQLAVGIKGGDRVVSQGVQGQSQASDEVELGCK